MSISLFFAPHAGYKQSRQSSIVNSCAYSTFVKHDDLHGGCIWHDLGLPSQGTSSLVCGVDRNLGLKGPKQRVESTVVVSFFFKVNIRTFHSSIPPTLKQHVPFVDWNAVCVQRDW